MIYDIIHKFFKFVVVVVLLKIFQLIFMIWYDDSFGPVQALGSIDASIAAIFYLMVIWIGAFTIIFEYLQLGLNRNLRNNRVLILSRSVWEIEIRNPIYETFLYLKYGARRSESQSKEYKLYQKVPVLCRDDDGKVSVMLYAHGYDAGVPSDIDLQEEDDMYKTNRFDMRIHGFPTLSGYFFMYFREIKLSCVATICKDFDHLTKDGDTVKDACLNLSMPWLWCVVWTLYLRLMFGKKNIEIKTKIVDQQGRIPFCKSQLEQVILQICRGPAACG